MKPADLHARETAARDLDTSLVVTAGAGTGKTSLLVERILHHVLERHTPLGRIAAITFTVKAAAELRERVEEALERSIVIATEETAPDPEKEADRVIPRLAGIVSPGAIAERARRALEELDGASIGTIHAFTSELLRRRHLEAGVDVGFQVDEGAAWAELFDELWAEHIARALGEEEGIDLWRELLGKAALDQVEDVARKIAGHEHPIEALEGDVAAAQRAAVRAIAAGWLADLGRIEDSTEGVAGLNTNLEGVLAKLRAVLESCVASGDCPAEAADLPKSCTIGGGAACAEAKELGKKLGRLLEGARALAASDAALAGQLAATLRSFIVLLRAEYARRGFVSFDGLVVLSRDLLRRDIRIRREEGARYDHILVDEFQDTDPIQYEIVFHLAEDPGARPAEDAFEARLVPGKLFIVGDAKQSIYRFRGADLAAYGRAVEAVRRSGGGVHELTSNFRSRPEIVGPLNTLFGECFRRTESSPEEDPEFAPLEAVRRPAGNPRIEIWSVGEDGVTASVRRRTEARVIAASLRQYLVEEHCQAREVAILLRARTELDALVQALREEGVDCIAEGGKGFFSRHEVELLAAFLRVFSNPADSISLVSCLRSPVCAVPDRELQLFAGHGPRWFLGARPDPSETPALARALEMLRGFAERHRNDPIDRMARAALEETPLRIAMAASFQGAQRVANLEKAVRHIAALASDGTLSPSEIMDRILAEDSFDPARGDSPLADEAIDAVRILTIHAAKGLEWHTVIVPDLAREAVSGRTDDVMVMSAAPVPSGAPPLLRPPPALALKMGGTCTPAFAARKPLEKLRDGAEEKRLLYVAATRARERLILVVGLNTRGSRPPWVQTLEAWGYSLDPGFPEGESFFGGAILHRPFPEEPVAPRLRQDAEPDPVLLAAARSFEEAAASLASRKPRRLSSPSGFRDEMEPEEPLPARRPRARERGGVRGAAPRAVARAAGTAAHLLLEVWDGKDPGWLFENATRAARVAAAREELDVEPVERRLRRILEVARNSRTLEVIAREGSLGRELPVLFRDGEGNLWQGMIDRLAGTPDLPWIIDFKTDSPGKDLPVIYEAQLALYAEAIRECLGLAFPPAAGVVLLSASTE